MLSLFFKSLLGALAVLLIAILSKNKNFFIAGLIPLFPTFALIAHYIVGVERNMEDLRVTALFGIFSLIPYLSYLVSVYFLSYKYNLVLTLILSSFIWLIFSLILFYFWTKFY